MHHTIKCNVHHVLLAYMDCLASVHAEAKSPKREHADAAGPQAERAQRMCEARGHARALVVFAGVVGRWLPAAVPAQLAAMEGAMLSRR